MDFGYFETRGRYERWVLEAVEDSDFIACLMWNRDNLGTPKTQLVD